MTQLDGSYFLTDEDGAIKASIGSIIVFTADERNNTFGALEAEPIKDQEIYLLTIVLDAEYLSDPNTAYPIRIDPEIRIDHDLYGSAAIEDVTIQSASASQGEFTASIVGVSQKGVSRLLLRILDAAYDFSELEGATVTSAWINLRDLMCESTPMTVTCYPYTGTPWTESTAQWSTLNQSWGEALDSYAISYSNGLNQYYDHWYRFHIESLVQAWINGEADQNQGVIFKADEAVESGNALLYKTIGSYERSAYKPSYVLTYQYSISLSTYYLELDIGEFQYVSVYFARSAPVTLRWGTSNPRIATVESETGKITARACGRAYISVWSEEDPTVRATLSVVVRPPQTQTPGITSNSVYMIKNVSSGTYLTASSSTKLTLSNKNEMNGKQLWYVVWNGSGYTLYSLGIKDIESSGEAVLKGAGLNNSPTLVPENGEYISWSIDKYNGHYYINNTIYHNDLSISVNTLTGDVSCMAYETEYARWEFERIETSTFNNYWDGGYKDQGETVYIKIYIDDSVYNNRIVKESHFDVIDQWNGISSRIVIYGPQDTVPEGIDPFSVTFAGKEWETEGINGQMKGINDDGDIAGSNEDWNKVIIYINTSTKGQLAKHGSGELVETTILHEFGHALKLTHPKQTENLADIPDGRGGYISDSMVVSIMNHGDPGMSSNLCVTSPTWHDIINLINKWGE